ncbi:LysR family transcriptional regulator [Gorillibacterium massiliense]|uniref:LysR family transcriptional regulator n=1 Tax=Gorillibacterium massiliense TaxID=1280390 RepID=UPI0004B8C0FF|nr:LysR family transcriptional regulator [Gorillibacterium massiliense]
MDIRHIQYFLEVIKKGSFSKAAEDLHISQPTISKLIKDFETELGITLLKRTTRKFELTDAGKVVYQQGQVLIQSFQNMFSELEDLKKAHQGDLQIGIYPMISKQFFTRINSAFQVEYPGITVRFKEDGAPNLKKALIEGQIDMALLPFPLEKDLFDYFPFFSANLLLVVHPSHEFAKKDQVLWSDLENESFIVAHQGFALHDIIMEQCKKCGFAPNIIGEATQWSFMLELVANNFGITILPQSELNELAEDASHMGLKVVSLEPAFEWKFALCWLKGGYLSYAAKEWIKFTNSEGAEKPIVLEKHQRSTLQSEE